MGRPINKKYFGNRNIGTGGYQTTQHGIANTLIPDEVYDGDDHIGGEGFAGVTFGASVADTSYGSGAYLNKIPHITSIGAPTIANGVQAVADVVTVKAVHAVVVQSGTPNNDAVQDYRSGDILTVMTGSPTTPAKFTVGALKVSGFTIVDRNSGITSEGYAVNDALHFDHGVVLTVATIGGTGYPDGLGNVQSLTLTNAGSYTGTTPPTGTVGQTNPNEVGGRGLTVNFSWGVRDVTVLVAGVYSSVAGSANTTSVTHADLSASTAAGCTLDIFYGVDTIQVTEKGSGYRGTETVTFTAADAGLSETRATGTMVLTTDSGNVGSETNQENAIIAYAWVDGLEEVDIIKQVSTDRYRINSNATENSDTGYVIGKLKVDGVAGSSFVGAEGTQMNIWAFDEDGGSYLVKKLTARKAVVYPFACARLSKSAGALFAAGRTIPWKFFEGQANASAGYVKIENA
jgi:hypothetical protein